MTTTITIKGTHCHSCQILLEEVIAEIPGVSQVRVDFSSGRTVIEHDRQLPWEKVQQAMKSVGDYQLDMASLAVSG